MNRFLQNCYSKKAFLKSNVDIVASLTSVQLVQLSKFSQKMGVPLKELLQIFQDIVPLKVAESWDNVGLLVEPSSECTIKTLLLTIDLTEDVVDEALEKKADLIVSYHPNIFRPLKRITQSHWKEKIIIKCIKNDIAVFSPHTSWDAMLNGVNDWLSGALGPLKFTKPILVNSENPDIGMGRIVGCESPVSLKQLIENVKRRIGIPHVRVGIAKHQTLETLISTVAICAGSGASVLNGVDADLYLTGEMLHHDVLEATQTGHNVILCNHNDSERGFLKCFQSKFKINNLEVLVSEVDKDCLKTY